MSLLLAATELLATDLLGVAPAAGAASGALTTGTRIDGIVTAHGTAAGALTAGVPWQFTLPDPMAVGSTPIRAQHFVELRIYANWVRHRHGLGDFAWTDPVITPGVTEVKRLHVIELRTALDAAIAAAGLTAMAWSEGITAGTTPVRALHIDELRTAIKRLVPWLTTLVRGTATIAASLTTQIVMAGVAEGSGVAIGDLVPPAVSVAGAPTISGTLTTAIPVVATATGTGTAAGAFTTAISLAAAPSGTAAARSSLSTPILLEASATGIAAAAATLTTPVRPPVERVWGVATPSWPIRRMPLQRGRAAALTASAQAAGASLATLRTRLPLAGGVEAVGAIQAALTTDLRLAASVEGPAQARGTLSTAIRLAAPLHLRLTTRAELQARHPDVVLSSTETLQALIEREDEELLAGVF